MCASKGCKHCAPEQRNDGSSRKRPRVPEADAIGLHDAAMKLLTPTNSSAPLRKKARLFAFEHDIHPYTDLFAKLHRSEKLRADKHFVLECVAKHGMVLCKASEGLRADKDVVLQAVAENGSALQSASDESRVSACLLLC